MWKNLFSIDPLSLGSGQYGEVKFAKNLETEQELCVKIIKKKKEFGVNVLKTQQKNEFDIAKALTNLSHPNLVKIIGVYNEEDGKEEYAYIFMELCENNLDYYLAQNKQIPNTVIDELITQVAQGYAVLEENKIIHRDLKPANLLYKTQNGQCVFKIADFGLGKILDPNNQIMTHGVGTPLYQAPELESNLYNDQCDIYSLGVIIFELLTGKMGTKSLFRFKEKEQLKEKSFSKIYQEELQNIEKPYQHLLDNMIVYEPAKRISWKELVNWKQLKKNFEQQSKIQNEQTSGINNFPQRRLFNSESSKQLNQQQNRQMQPFQRQVSNIMNNFPNSQFQPTFPNQLTQYINIQSNIQQQQQHQTPFTNFQMQSLIVQQNTQQQQQQQPGFLNYPIQNFNIQSNTQQQQQQPAFTNQPMQNANVQSNIQQQQQQPGFPHQQTQNNSMFSLGQQRNHSRQSSFPSQQQQTAFNSFSQQQQQQSSQQQQQQQQQNQSNQGWQNNQSNQGQQNNQSNQGWQNNQRNNQK